MTQSTKDEPSITKKEFEILKEIVKGLPDQNGRASLATATESYERVLRSHHLEDEPDNVYFSALLKLNHFQGSSWREKLLNVAGRLEDEYKANKSRQLRAHRRHRSENSPTRINSSFRPEVSSRSVLQQKLDRASATQEALQPIRKTSRDYPPISDQGYTLTQEGKYALVQKYRLWGRKQSEKLLHSSFHHWLRDAKFVRKLRREQTEYAIHEDHHTLKWQAFDKWYGTWRTYHDAYKAAASRADQMPKRRLFRKWENKTIDRRQEQYLAKMVAEQESLFIALFKKNQKKHLSAHLCAWRDRLSQLEHAEDEVVRSRTQALKEKAWAKWFHKRCVALSDRCTDISMKRRAFHFWRARHHVYKEQLEENDAFAMLRYNKRLKAKYWDIWSFACTDRELYNADGEQYFRRKRLASAFSTWFNQMTMAQKHNQVRHRMHVRIARDTLGILRQVLERRLVKQSHAWAIAEHNLRLKLFFNWKGKTAIELTVLDFQQCTMRGLARYCLDVWQSRLTELRVQQLHLIIIENTKSRALKRWNDKFRSLRGVLDIAENTIMQSLQSKNLALCFRTWRLIAARNVKWQSEADNIYARSIAGSALSRMRCVGRQLIEHHKDADHFASRIILHRWDRSLQLKQERDRQSALRNHLKQRNADLILSCLDHWKSAHSHYQDLTAQAKQSLVAWNHNIARQHFRVWTNRQMDMFDLKNRAVDIDCKISATHLLGFLLQKYLDRLPLAKTADSVWYDKVLHEASRHMLRWREKYRKALERNEVCSFHATRFERRNARRIVKLWLQKMREIRRSKLGDDSLVSINDVSSNSSIDASRTRTPWNDTRSIRYHSREFGISVIGA